MVKNCAVALVRLSAMDEDGVAATDALALEMKTVADDDLVVLMPTGMARYLGTCFRSMAKEIDRRGGSGVASILFFFRLLVVTMLLLTYLLVGWLSGFAHAAQLLAMGLGGTYALAFFLRHTVFPLLAPALLRVIRYYKR